VPSHWHRHPAGGGRPGKDLAATDNSLLGANDFCSNPWPPASSARVCQHTAFGGCRTAEIAWPLCFGRRCKRGLLPPRQQTGRRFVRAIRPVVLTFLTVLSRTSSKRLLAFFPFRNEPVRAGTLTLNAVERSRSPRRVIRTPVHVVRAAGVGSGPVAGASCWAPPLQSPAIGIDSTPHWPSAELHV